ncbi:MAG: DsrE family protein [bacterium]
MKTKLNLILLIVLSVFVFNIVATAQEKTECKSDELVILWTSGDKEVAENMVFMFTQNAPKYGWWEANKITLLIWGPSDKLLAEDEALQKRVVEMKTAGIKLEACKACADKYQVSEKLTALGVDVKYMGEVLANYIKEGRKILTL